MESYLNRAFPSGVLGMAGNMWRWCSSLHEPGFSIGELGSRIARRVPSIASQSWAGRPAARTGIRYLRCLTRHQGLLLNGKVECTDEVVVWVDEGNAA